MQSRQVKIPKGYDTSRVNGIIEHLCAKEGLVRKIKRTLKGSTHWHFKKANEIGTLEITLWPSKSRISFSIHDNRRGTWTGTSSRKLAAATREAFRDRKK